ncbi:hypothetical protein R3P38DRAFT_2600668 [Favolaschia claudopus]|uniref:BTB domain-containing protein n=1 Tax=Favolaschia claudopus TaxID=2862362 RepID=A0AAW0DT50_9AGAR
MTKRKHESDTDDEAREVGVASDQAYSATKRTKTAFSKHGRFWALDGNVILMFGSVAFRVHRSRFSTESIWFKKLFERSAGQEELLDDDEMNILDVGVEEVDGIDVYYLDGISNMEDFEALLSAMDDAIHYPDNPPSFLTLAAIFRAATTFKCWKFKNFAQQRLFDLFPNNLRKLTRAAVPHAEAAVVLGRGYELPSILKRAYYEILRTAPQTDPAPDRFAEWEEVDFVRLGETQKHLAAAWSRLLTPSFKVCPGPPCAVTQRNAAISILCNALFIAFLKYPLDPIGGLLELASAQWMARGFCQRCANNHSTTFGMKADELWENLDTWLEIDT